MNLDKFFNPHSIAVVGASAQKEKVGFSLVYNLLQGRQREIYPVNNSQSEVLGLKCYPSILEIKNKIDLAVIAVRAENVVSALDECGKKKVPAVIIISAGFKESGEKGASLEKEIQRVAQEYEMAVLGPNCLGIVDARADLNVSFAVEKPLPGGISFLSQSGAIGTAMFDWARQAGVGLAKFISLGNETMLTEIDFLDYLADDSDTKAVLVYLEKVSNGQKFMELAKKLSAKKPIVILKAGRSRKGLAAAMSHTGSLAPEDAVFTAACRQSGAIVVESLRQLFNLAKLFQLGIIKPRRRLAVLTNGGGPSVIAADLIELSRSLELIELHDETKQALQRVLPPMAAVNNPVDVVGDAPPSRYEEAFKILTAEKEIDAILAILTPQMMTDIETIARLFVYYSKKKPVIPLLMGGEAVTKGLAVLKEGGLVNFDFPGDVVEALDVLGGEQIKRVAESSPKKPPTSLTMQDFNETKFLLRKYGVELVGVFIEEKEKIGAVLKNISGPSFALKVVSPEVIHKTDFNAVRLNLSTAEEISRAWEEIRENIRVRIPNAKIQGMILQPMLKGKEIIIGMKQDPVFGPVLVFGLGGIFAEVLQDVAMRVAPVGEKEIQSLIEEIRGFPLLAGRRGEKPINFEKLVQLISAISHLALEHPEIKEIDLNPVFATENDIAVVDARLMRA